MPLYFFRVSASQVQVDEDGIELANAEEARVTAVRIAGRIIADDELQAFLGDVWHMDVIDAEEWPLFRLHFRFSEGPGLREAGA